MAARTGPLPSGRASLWVPPALYAADGRPSGSAPTLVTSYKASLPNDAASLRWDDKADRLVRGGVRNKEDRHRDAARPG